MQRQKFCSRRQSLGVGIRSIQAPSEDSRPAGFAVSGVYEQQPFGISRRYPWGFRSIIRHCSNRLMLLGDLNAWRDRGGNVRSCGSCGYQLSGSEVFLRFDPVRTSAAPALIGAGPLPWRRVEPLRCGVRGLGGARAATGIHRLAGGAAGWPADRKPGKEIGAAMVMQKVGSYLAALWLLVLASASPVTAETGPCVSDQAGVMTCGQGPGAARVVEGTTSPSKRLAFAWRAPGRSPTEPPD